MKHLLYSALILIVLAACLQAAPVYEIVKVEETLNAATKNIAAVEVVITATEGDFSMSFHKKLNAEELASYKEDKAIVKQISVQMAADNEVPFLARKQSSTQPTPFVSEKKDTTSTVGEKVIDPAKIEEAKAK